MQFDAFISYSGTDKLTADAACASLEAAGVRCWIAPRDIMPGREYGDALVDALDHCRVMVLVFSSRANTSPQIRREVERVVSRGVPVLPLRIEDVVPTRSMAYFVGSVHWLDALTPPLEQHLQRLAGAVKALLDVGPDRGSTVPGAPDVNDAPALARDTRFSIVEIPEQVVAPVVVPPKAADPPAPAADNNSQSAGALSDSSERDATAAGTIAIDTLDVPAPPEPVAAPVPRGSAHFLLLFGVARCLATIAFWSILGSRTNGNSGSDLLLLVELMASGAAAIFVALSLRRAGRASATVKTIGVLGALSELCWFIFSAVLFIGGSAVGFAILLVCVPSPFGVAAYFLVLRHLRQKQTALV